MNAAFILLLLFAPYSIGSITEITLDSKDLKQIDSKKNFKLILIPFENLSFIISETYIMSNLPIILNV